jgi:uncharacterized protein YbjT (DUF2867 family)
MQRTPPQPSDPVDLPATTILVTGGTGKTGSRVAERLAAGGHDVRIGSRSAAVPFDWHDRATWPAAVRGVRAAYLAYAPDLSFPGAAETVGELATFAADHGVQHLVLLSGRGEGGAQTAERLVQRAGTTWTIVRAAVFAQNFSEGAFVDQVRDGAVALHVADVPEPFVDVEDVADVAVEALTDERHAGVVHELTGPQLLTFAEALEIVGRAIGRPVVYVRVGAGELLEGMVAAGVPADDAGHLVALFGEILDGRGSVVTDGVQRALGRPARDFAGYVARAAASGAWAREVVA